MVPTGVTVLQVSPATLSLTFETSAVRTVPVVPDIDDEPAPGFEVAHVTADPATVEVSGPSSAVNSVTEATTEPVSVRGATRPVIDTVTVGVPDSIVRLRSSAQRDRDRGHPPGAASSAWSRTSLSRSVRPLREFAPRPARPRLRCA